MLLQAVKLLAKYLGSKMPEVGPKTGFRGGGRVFSALVADKSAHGQCCCQVAASTPPHGWFKSGQQETLGSGGLLNCIASMLLQAVKLLAKWLVNKISMRW